MHPKNSAQRLGTEPLTKLIFSLALPAVLAQLVNLLYNIVDRIYIGHLPGVGPLALTGLGLCSPLLMLVSAFAAFAGNGGAPLAAIELGRGDREKANHILANAMVLIGGFSVILTVLLLLVKRPLLYFFGASDATIDFADDYLTVYLCGTLFVQIALGLNTFITCQGQAKTAMVSVLIGAVSNIVLDPIFIFVLDMGVKGAALATVLSQMLSAAWVLRFLFSDRSLLRIDLRDVKAHWPTIGRIASLGVSPFIMNSTESLIAIVFTSGLQRYGGDTYVGTYTVLQSAMQLMFVPASGFSHGTQPIVSYNYGAGNYDRVKKTFRLISLICLVYTMGFYLFTAACPRVLAGIFTSDEAFLALCAEKLPIFLFGMSIFAFQMAAQSAFLGMGQAKISLFIACLRKILLLTPLALILPRFFGVDGIYYAEPISDAISALTSLGLFLWVSHTKLKEPGDLVK